MSLTWIHERPALFDADKATILGSAPGVFKSSGYHPGDLIPGDWWRVEDDGRVVGYGWMDTVFADAEILLAVAPSAQQHGVGTFILDHLEREALGRGYNYLFNVVPAGHPDPEGLRRWLEQRHFQLADDGRLMRRVLSRKS